MSDVATQFDTKGLAAGLDGGPMAAVRASGPGGAREPGRDAGGDTAAGLAARKDGGKRGASRRLKRVAMGLGGAALLASFGVALRPKLEAAEIVAARRDTLRVTVRESGRTRVIDRYVVSAPASGRLTRIMLRPGDAVGEGEVVARITALGAPLLDARARTEAEARSAAATAARAQVEANVARAEAASAFARAELERERGLFQGGAQSEQAVRRAELEARLREQDLASARFGVRVAEHELAMARAALAPQGASAGAAGQQTPVDSPVAGRVLAVQRQSEGAVQAGAPLLEIGDPGALELVVDLLSADAVRVHSGAEAVVDGWGGPPLRARVRRVEPSAFTKTSALGVEEQRVNVVLDLEEPRERRAAIGDGYQIEAEIVLEEVPDALVVPEGALFRHGGSWALYVEDQGAARLRAVRLGARDGRRAQVVDGLGPGERVVVHPSDRVGDGTRVVAR